MKIKIIYTWLYFLIIGLFPNNSKCQTTWPPGGQERSPFKITLPEGRFLPSSKRWNLIWADQLVPSWIREKHLEFAAKRFIGTQKIWKSQIEQFRKFNPNFLNLIYHLAAGLNPERNSDCPDPKTSGGSDFIGVVSPAGYVSEWKEHFLPWLSKMNITLESPRFENMFQHYDTIDKNHRVWHQDPYWLMNIINPDWTDYIAQQASDWIIGNSGDGCFFDVSVEFATSLYNPKLSNPSPKNFNWWQIPHGPDDAVGKIDRINEFAKWINPKYLKYYKFIYNKLHNKGNDFLIIPNTDQMVTTNYDPVWLDGDSTGETIDGAMMEGWGNYYKYDMWLTIDRAVRHITGRGKILIAQFGANTSAERMRRTGMYMLVKNENSYICINPGSVDWYPEYEIDLGEQSRLPASLDSLRVNGTLWSSLFKRDYDNGCVLCNTSDSDIVFKPEETGDWYKVETTGGGVLSDSGYMKAQSIKYIPLNNNTIAVPWNNCIILKKNISSIKSAEFNMNKIDFEIFPTIVDDNASIRLRSGEFLTYEISIFDCLGVQRMFLSKGELSSEETLLNIDAEGLTCGVYFVRLSAGGTVMTKKIIVK
ncbi:MAG: hypothetical protein HW421_4026 [Ignavibacteria bacterium]|nr:hypothetical protein [Ignavibacteria bacterium]